MRTIPGYQTLAPIAIEVDGDRIAGDLMIPHDADGIVIFAHGSGSGRFSSRNRLVAQSLNDDGFATLLLDLLTEREEQVDRVTREHRFDIPLLARRVVAAVDWCRSNARTQALPIGLFGASTGAAAALVAAGIRPHAIAAVVSRGGRPDLAGDMLEHVLAPTLLIVGGADAVVIDLNQLALERMRCSRRISVVPGATHLFEEPGALDQVCGLASRWFAQHLHSVAPASSAAEP